MIKQWFCLFYSNVWLLTDSQKGQNHCSISKTHKDWNTFLISNKTMLKEISIQLPLPSSHNCSFFNALLCSLPGWASLMISLPLLLSQMSEKKISNTNYPNLHEPCTESMYWTITMLMVQAGGWFINIDWTIVLPKEPQVSIAYISLPEAYISLK